MGMIVSRLSGAEVKVKRAPRPLARFVDAMRVLSDETCVKALAALSESSLSLAELRLVLGMRDAPLRDGLERLLRSGLIGVRRRGRGINYYVRPDCGLPCLNVILDSLQEWLDVDPEINRLLRALEELPAHPRHDQGASVGSGATGPKGKEQA